MHQFEVLQMLMIETARYDDMYLRPYVTNFDQHISNQMIQATEHGTNVNPITLASSASAFLQPSSIPVGMANIANGFSEKRLSFMLEIRDVNASGLHGNNRYILTGYTDHLGVVDATGKTHIDPNMAMYFNNMFLLRDTMIQTPMGRSMTTNLAQSRHILHNQGSGDYFQQVPKQFTMRPEDVMAVLDFDTNPIMAEFRGGNVYDSRSTLTGVTTSDRRKEARPTYLNDTIHAARSAEIQTDTYGNTDENSLWSSARDTLREETIANSKFFSILSGTTNYHQQGCVSYRELANILPDLDHKAEVIMSGAAQQSKEYLPGQGEAWTGSSLETIASTILQQLVPGIMTDCLMLEIGFRATNDTLNGQDDVVIYHHRGFTSGIDYSKYMVYFIDRVKREILWDISKNGQMSYSVDCHINLLFDSNFNISINGQPFIYYASPAFCDGLYAPILSNDLASLETMAHDVGNMVNNISGDYNRMIVGQESAQPSPNEIIVDPYASTL